MLYAEKVLTISKLHVARLKTKMVKVLEVHYTPFFTYSGDYPPKVLEQVWFYTVKKVQKDLVQF